MRALLGYAMLAAALAVPAHLDAQSWRTMTSARQLNGEEALDVEVKYAAGRLVVGPAKGPMLYEMKLRYDEDDFTPLSDYDAAAGSLKLGVTGRVDTGPRVSGESESRAEISLGRGVPLALDLTFGAGEADLDLGGLSLRSVDISTGASDTHVRFDSPNQVRSEEFRVRAGAAELRIDNIANARADKFDFAGGVGETTLDFGGTWENDMEAQVKLGIGEVNIRIPRNVGVRISKKAFLASFDTPGFVQRNGALFSRNWDEAEHRLTLDVDAALGSIRIRWID